MPPVTRTLIMINVVVYIAEAVTNAPLGELALWPIGPYFMPWQLLTYGFLHAGLTHILVNMYALFLFGGEIERLFGGRWFLVYFLVCVLTAGVTQIAVAAVTHAPPYPTVGASGGIFGLLLAFGMYFPHRRIVPLIPPIPMPAWVFVTIYGVLELFLGVSGWQQNVAHFAHLGGMIGGYLMIVQRRGRWWG